MDIVIFIFLLLIIAGVQLRPAGASDDFFNKENTAILRGIFAFVVVISHLASLTEPSPAKLWPILTSFGRVSVAVFFLISGYGLMTNFMKKRELYLKDFIVRRFLTTLIPFLFAGIIYYIVLNIIDRLPLKYALLSLVRGEPFIMYGWYIIAILFFYLAFYVVARFSRSDNQILISILLITCFYILACYFSNRKVWWYDSCLAFPLGIFYGQYRERINLFIKQNWHKLLLVTLAIFSVAFTLMEYSTSFIFKELTCLSFAVFVILAFSKITIKSRIFSFLANISLEIYLYHGLVYMVLLAYKDKFPILKNNGVFTIIAFLVIPPLALIAHKVNQVLITRLRKRLILHKEKQII